MTPILVLLIVVWIFRSWFLISSTLSAGDWPYLYLENIKEFSFIPSIHYLWLAPYYQTLTKLLVVYGGLPWGVVERVFWFWPFVVVSFWSAYRFTKSTIGALIYTTNTYALMIIGGGQMGIGMAYALAPLVFESLTKSIESAAFKQTFKQVLLIGLILALDVMFDPRIAAVTFGASILYLLFGKIPFQKIFKQIFFPLGIAFFIHLYWIIPLVASRSPIKGQLSEATSGLLKFLSFASFSQTLSLLHPNWPENIFGKTYFMQPEFLILPLIAFSSLILLNKKNSKTIPYFSFMALLGAFLAKGTNPPFGGIYAFLFGYVPGFVLFRDATKFYLFTALSFSILIPLTLASVQERLPKRVAFMLPFIFIFFWLFTIRQALFGGLTGTFKPVQVPTEYVKLKDFLVHDPRTYSTLWIPERQRFGFSSSDHPGLSLREIDDMAYDHDYLLGYFKDKKLKDLMSQKSARYVIVPFDSRGEIFLTDHAYDDRLKQEIVASVSAIPWLVKKEGYGNISIYGLR